MLSEHSATVNGTPRELPSDGRSLLRWLRENLGLTGSKQGCGRGQCGACTVLVDGRSVLACCTVAAFHRGAHIQTIEGLADADHPDPLLGEFVAAGAIQCGFCTPGMVMAAKALLSSCNGNPSSTQAREALAGNLCRCTGYAPIVAAILAVRDAELGDAGEL